MLKVGIKYCGGCNPYYDRVALVKEIEARLNGQVQFVSHQAADSDLILAIEGCRTATMDSRYKQIAYATFKSCNQIFQNGKSTLMGIRRCTNQRYPLRFKKKFHFFPH